MASLSYLQPYLADTQAKAIELNVSSPVVDALLALLYGMSISYTVHCVMTVISIDLNLPRTAYHSIRPLDIIAALVNHSPSKHNSLFSSREHQDAQELFQLVSEC